MHTILIKNGLLVDPGSGTLREEDLLVKDGMIAGRGAYSGEMADRVIDASGLAVLPGPPCLPCPIPRLLWIL